MSSEKKGIVSYVITGLLIFIIITIVSSVSKNSTEINFSEVNGEINSKDIRPEIGFLAPDFSYPDMRGDLISLKSNKGKVVLLNIWATWCGPCVAEMPAIEKLYNRLKSDKFEVLAVSVDTQGVSVVEPFVKKMALTFPILLDTKDTITYMYNTNSIPQTFLIDKDGRIAAKVMGARDWSSNKSVEAIEYLINN